MRFFASSKVKRQIEHSTATPSYPSELPLLHCALPTSRFLFPEQNRAVNASAFCPPPPPNSHGIVSYRCSLCRFTAARVRMPTFNPKYSPSTRIQLDFPVEFWSFAFTLPFSFGKRITFTPYYSSANFITALTLKASRHILKPQGSWQDHSQSLSRQYGCCLLPG
jgi:hypothetical protein